MRILKLVHKQVKGWAWAHILLDIQNARTIVPANYTRSVRKTNLCFSYRFVSPCDARTFSSKTEKLNLLEIDLFP